MLGIDSSQIKDQIMTILVVIKGFELFKVCCGLVQESELQITESTEDNSKINFLISQQKQMQCIVTPH